MNTEAQAAAQTVWQSGLASNSSIDFGVVLFCKASNANEFQFQFQAPLLAVRAWLMTDTTVTSSDDAFSIEGLHN